MPADVQRAAADNPCAQGTGSSQSLARGISRREWLGVAALFLCALGLRFFHLQELQANDPFFELPSVDARMYHEWALEIAGGDWWGKRVFLNGPLYPYALASVYALFGPSLFAAKAAQCVLGALTCVLTWALARRLFDARVALLAGAFSAVGEMLIFFEGTLVVANLITPLVLLVLLAVIAALERPSAARWLGAGALVGVSALARPNVLLFGVATAVWLVYVSRREPRSRLLVRLGAFGLGVALLVLPVTARNYAVGGDLVLVTYAGGLNLFIGNNADANGSFIVPRIFPRSAVDDPWEQREVYEAAAEQVVGRELRPSEVSRYWAGEAWRFVREQPSAWLQLLGRKLALFVNAFEAWNIRSIALTRLHSRVLQLPLLSFGLLAPLALIGLALTAGRRRQLLPLYAMLGTFMLSAMLFFVLSRYRVSIVPVLAVFAAAGVIGVFDAGRIGRWGRIAIALPLAALFAYFIVHADIVREDLSIAYYNLANRYKTLERWEPAIEAYQEALRRKPGYLSGYNNLALVYEADGSHDREAILTWERVLELAEQQGSAKHATRAHRHLKTLRARSAIILN